MLRSMKALDGFTIGATDGDIGTVKEGYFDDLIRSCILRITNVDSPPVPNLDWRQTCAHHGPLTRRPRGKWPNC